MRDLCRSSSVVVERVAADLVSEAREAKRLPDMESPMCRYSSAVVEQLTCNQQVPSSTLGGGTIVLDFE